MKFLSKLTTQDLFCSELKVKDYKKIIKTCYGDNIDPKVFVENLCDILACLTSKPLGFIKSLNIIDLFCLLLDIRINSQGNETKLNYKDEEKQKTITLNLSQIRKDITQLSDKLTTSIKIEPFDIVLECPSVERLIDSKGIEYTSFIKQVNVKTQESIKTFLVNSNEEASNFLDRVSPKILIEVLQQFKTFIEDTTKINFLAHYNIYKESLYFLPSIESLLWYTKIIFNESPENIYANIFQLSVGAHFNSDYIENCAVGEYIFFVNCLKQMNKPPEQPQQ